MSHQSSVFDRIILGDLRPWLETNRYEEKFKSEIGDIIPVEPPFQTLYEFDFLSRLNYKTRYYHKLITAEANNYCNHLIESIGSEDDQRVIKSLLRDKFKLKVKSQLNEVAKIIKAYNYDIKYIYPQKSDFSADKDHKSDTYVIQLLKTALIKVYLEIQEVFKSYISIDDYMEINDLQALAESSNEPTFLKRQTILEMPIDVKIEKPKIKKVTSSDNKSFTYKKLDTNPDALNDLFNSLKLNPKPVPFIDEKTSIYDFKKVFSNKEIKNPIRWTGNISDLYYFIVLIHNVNKSVQNISPYHWQVACRCFIKPGGTAFDPGKLKSQKTPKINAKMIEKVASNLHP
jgi:hypothetical protein